MNCLLYVFQLILIQYSLAQVISLGGRNFMNNQNCNLPVAANFANNGLLTNMGQTGQIITPVNNLGQEYLITNANYANNIGLTGGNMLAGNIGLATGNILGGETIVAYNNEVPMYANVVKPPREYGIEFSSGALSVGGNVEVNGRMPFNANVAFSGTVPALGQGAVDYKCEETEKS